MLFFAQDYQESTKQINKFTWTLRRRVHLLSTSHLLSAMAVLYVYMVLYMSSFKKNMYLSCTIHWLQYTKWYRNVCQRFFSVCKILCNCTCMHGIAGDIIHIDALIQISNSKDGRKYNHVGHKCPIFPNTSINQLLKAFTSKNTMTSTILKASLTQMISVCRCMHVWILIFKTKKHYI